MHEKRAISGFIKNAQKMAKNSVFWHFVTKKCNSVTFLKNAGSVDL
jgi:hypothetical protein